MIKLLGLIPLVAFKSTCLASLRDQPRNGRKLQMMANAPRWARKLEHVPNRENGREISSLDPNVFDPLLVDHVPGRSFESSSIPRRAATCDENSNVARRQADDICYQHRSQNSEESRYPEGGVEGSGVVFAVFCSMVLFIGYTPSQLGLAFCIYLVITYLSHVTNMGIAFKLLFAVFPFSDKDTDEVFAGPCASLMNAPYTGSKVTLVIVTTGGSTALQEACASWRYHTYLVLAISTKISFSTIWLDSYLLKDMNSYFIAKEYFMETAT
ncbi:hypothetical protein CCUS01_15122 [Colletotrichum cuscutae]|uniref:Uncharacterized protein n=1 Tax=Colletotrichum cuscutae TaxID=1209917 RepID=A0AAI9VIH3_9PEZI|nr:hypothetical protein CCUS01_15122 [Colletotrichum cuscutae]